MKHHILGALLALALFCIPKPALSSESLLDAASAHLARDNPFDALQSVQDHLQRQPRDPRGLFLKAWTMERLGRFSEAMDIYRDLISAHPELPEPYNNLARLLAGQGRFEEAGEVLQNALQTHPSYAVAYRNLSKIYSAMAGHAYRRLLGTETGTLYVSLDPLENLTLPEYMPLMAAVEGSRSGMNGVEIQSPSTLPKGMSAEDLALICDPLISAETTSPQALPPSPEPAEIPAPETQPAPPPMIAPPAAVQPPAPMVISSEVSPADAPAKDESSAVKSEVSAVVHNWAKAWADQNVAAYLSFYSSAFQPEGNLDYDQWREQRKTRVAAPPFINVAISNIDVTIDDQDSVQVRFMQRYRSNVVNGQVLKELQMRKEHGQWRITRERLLPR